MGRPRLRRSVSPSVTTSNTWTRSWSKSATKTWPSPATTPDSWQNGKLLPVKTCSSLPLRLSSCTRLPTNSATTIEPLAMIAQASGSSKGTAVRNTRRKAPSYVYEIRGLDTMARPRAAARQPPSRGCVRGADKAGTGPSCAACCVTVTEKTTRRLLSVSAIAHTRHAVTNGKGICRWAHGVGHLQRLGVAAGGGKKGPR